MKKIIIALSFFGIASGVATSVFAGYFNTTPVQRCDTQITRTLQVGSENNDVYVLQNMLRHAGYLYVSPNGYFGPSTKAAVKRFQGANGVAVTGVVGEATRNAVNERLCDVDVRGESYQSGGYNGGTTYVSQYDPYVKVILPEVTAPAIYATPQENAISFSTTQTRVNQTQQNQASASQVLYPSVSVGGGEYIAPMISEISGSKIVYNPNTGYNYSLTQKSGSLTITTPRANSVYSEGDTVTLTWTTNGIQAHGYVVLLENMGTLQSKQVSSTKGNTVSFTLTKELLDAVCASLCNNGQQGMFRIVISTPMVDIAGNTSNFRAAVSPITVKRPYTAYAAVSLTTSKTPVDSGEKFRVYVHVPTTDSNNVNISSDTVVKLRAVCVNNIQVNIAGVLCGQELVMPTPTITAQSGVPVMITNSTWYKQDVTFEAVLTNRDGQIIGISKTTVNANPAPFVW